MNAERRLPWVKWFPTDWLGDSRVQRAPLAVRGAWFEILNHMFHEGEASITATAQEFATGIVHATKRETVKMLSAISLRGIADVEWKGSKVTVVSRRLMRDLKRKEGDKIRQRRHRAGGEE